MKVSAVNKIFSLILCLLLTVSMFSPAVYAVDGQTIIEMSSQEANDSDPVTDEPIDEDPLTEEPLSSDPEPEVPITEEPAQDEPVSDEPIEEEPIEAEPSNEASEEDALNAEAPVMSVGTTVNVSSVAALRTAIANASYDYEAPTIIKLTANINAVNREANVDYAFRIDGGQCIILDLNGRTITTNKNFTYEVSGYTSNGYLFQNRGDLTITDSSAAKTGRIQCYGYFIFNNGNLTVDGGRIVCKQTVSGVTQYWNTIRTCYGNVTINGGTIEGARIYNEASTINFNGGTVIGSNGCVYIDYLDSSKVIISNNTTFTNLNPIHGDIILDYSASNRIYLADALTHDITIDTNSSISRNFYYAVSSADGYSITASDASHIKGIEAGCYNFIYDETNNTVTGTPNERGQLLLELREGSDYTLTKDITVYGGMSLYGVEEEATLNLNGHTLNLIAKENNYGYMENTIHIDGYKLTVCSKDSSGIQVPNGKISLNGGDFYIHAGGELTLDGVTVMGDFSSMESPLEDNSFYLFYSIKNYGTLALKNSTVIDSTEKKNILASCIFNGGIITEIDNCSLSSANGRVIQNGESYYYYEMGIRQTNHIDGTINLIKNSHFSVAGNTAINNYGAIELIKDTEIEVTSNTTSMWAPVGIVIASGGRIGEIAGSTVINAEGNCISLNCYENDLVELYGTPQIDLISGGTFTSTGDYYTALSINNGNITSITGGTFNGYCAASLNGGRIDEISGGVFNGEGEGFNCAAYYDYYDYVQSGNTWVPVLRSSGEIALISGGEFSGGYSALSISEAEVTSISGGTFNGGDTAIRVYGGSIGEISDGTFSGNYEAVACYADYSYNEKTKTYVLSNRGEVASITGGEFTGGLAALSASGGDFTSVTGGSFEALGYSYVSGQRNSLALQPNNKITAPTREERVCEYSVSIPSADGELLSEKVVYSEQTVDEDIEINSSVSSNIEVAPSDFDMALEVLQNLYSSDKLGFGFVTYDGSITFEGDLDISGYSTDLQTASSDETSRFFLLSPISGDGYSICSVDGEKDGGIILSGTNDYSLTQYDLELLNYFGSSNLVLDAVNNIIKLNLVATKSLRLNETAITVAVGESYQLSKIVTPTNATGTVEWSSSNTDVAEVNSDGLVTAKGIGTAKITVEAYNGKKATCTVTVKKGLSTDMVTLLEGEEYEYTGLAIEPTYSIMNNGTELRLNTDYTVSFENSTDVASEDSINAPSIIFTGKGSYTGTITVKYSITQKALNDEMLEAYQSVQYYTGGEIEPISLINGNIKLEKDTDYTVTYDADNISTGTKVATVEGIGNYVGTITVEFEIVPTKLDKSMVAAIPEQEYIAGHVAVEPELKVAYGVTWLESGVDYTVRYLNNTNAGVATAIITGAGNFEGEISVTYEIKTKTLSKTMPQQTEDQIYTGEELTPVIVKDGTETLIFNTDYEITYKRNINKGTATATIKGINSYKGTVTVSFKIVAKEIAEDAIEAIADEEYTGSQIKPLLTVNDEAVSLVLNKDYTVKYTNNINAGTATVTVTGKGNYSGTATEEFTILPKETTFAISTIRAQTYSGGELKPTITVKDGRKTLKAGTDYTVEYNENIEVGTASVSVAGTGNYSESSTASQEFTINPIAISKATIKLPTHIKLNSDDPEANKAEPEVEFNGEVLSNDTDYTLSYQNIDGIGTATVVFTGAGNFAGTVRKTYRIVDKNVIEDCSIEALTDEVYTGSAIRPDVTVSDSEGTELTLGTDYTVSYKNNTKAGTATVTISGKGAYTGTKSTTFDIQPKELANTDEDVVINAISDKVYTSKEIKPAVTVKWNGKTLKLKTDYTVAYSDNIDHGRATITLSLTGNYSGTLTTEFNINAYPVSKLSVTAIKSQYYTGSEITPEPVVKMGKTVLTLNDDYTLEYDNNIEIGRAKVTIKGADGSNFDLEDVEKTVNFSIVKHLIGASDVTVSGIEDKVYDGTEQVQDALSLMFGEVPLEEGIDKDYTVKYSNNVKVGTAKITISGKGVFTGTRTITFKITGREFDAALSDDSATFNYNGKAWKPAVTTTDTDDSSREMKLGRDYVVSYKNNINTGDATITIIGKGNYAGQTKTLDFEIEPKDAVMTVGTIKTQIYDGYAKRPTLVVKDGSKTLKYGIDYVAGYAYNTYAGKAQVTVTGVGNYSSDTSITKTFDIVMPKMAFTGAKNIESGKATLTWKAMSGAGKYGIEYSTDKAFPEDNTSFYSVENGEANTADIGGLTVNTTYYFRIAMIDNSETPEPQMGDYGTVKSLRITK